MATVTLAGSTWTTATGNKAVTATPVADDLIVVCHGMSGWVSGDNSTITDDQGGTYFKIGTATAPLSSGGGTACALWISVREQLASAVSTIFTATNTGDTGGGLTVFRVAGMTRTGTSAVLQNIGESTQTESPVVLTLTSAPQAGNPIIAHVFGEDNPAALGAPTGWTESVDTGWATPATGVWSGFINSGGSQTITWSAGAFIDHNEGGVELDTTAAPTASGIGSYGTFGWWG